MGTGQADPPLTWVKAGDDSLVCSLPRLFQLVEDPAGELEPVL